MRKDGDILVLFVAQCTLAKSGTVQSGKSSALWLTAMHSGKK